MVGATITYSAVPWFWSDQFECTLQIAGAGMGDSRWSRICYAAAGSAPPWRLDSRE
ncbi:oxidoreductase C-terminal domain-containing protein [Mesorhizobium sp. M0088]|uniref:oxidoreductase C-terminal domain-containing protein n=1 Tax=Mesorhizobium sp. M0088 TaxID=2956873 RepID=UPI00333C8642